MQLATATDISIETYCVFDDIQKIMASYLCGLKSRKNCRNRIINVGHTNNQPNRSTNEYVVDIHHDVQLNIVVMLVQLEAVLTGNVDV